MSQEKLREAILYVCHKSEEDRQFGYTKLNKLLWFADVAAYLQRGKSITDEEYQKLKFGPAPRAMVPVMGELAASGAIEEVKVPVVDFPRSRHYARRTARIDVFSPEEIAILDAKIQQHWGQNARRMTALSHELLGWRAAELGETIPLESARITKKSATQRERLKAAELVKSGAYRSFHHG